MPASTQPASGGASVDLSDYPDVVDMNVFEQILEMDDDSEEREFSTEIVQGFFEQAEGAMEKMQNSLEEQSMKELSETGHFLKGSSATLGLVKVQKTCEKIQHFGAGLDAGGTNRQPDQDQSLRDIQKSLSDLQGEYKEAKQVLSRFFKLESS